jgi:phosphate starvation-inducible PhoH-like protein
MIEDQILEIAPLSMMRGRTFKNSWIIADEMQNATPAQAKMLMTRIGTNSKIVITGDAEQTDIKHCNNALVDLCERLQKGGEIKGLVFCKFETRDIQRHPIISPILKLYED